MCDYLCHRGVEEADLVMLQKGNVCQPLLQVIQCTGLWFIVNKTHKHSYQANIFQLFLLYMCTVQFRKLSPKHVFAQCPVQVRLFSGRAHITGAYFEMEICALEVLGFIFKRDKYCVVLRNFYVHAVFTSLR